MTEIANNMLLEPDTNEWLHLSMEKGRRRGVALLVVLFIIMVITVLSLGFLSGSNVELACGQNTVTVTQLGYLAESGLEHAKGLIVSPQDASSEYWTGDTGQQLASGNDFYDVTVVRDDSDSTDRCNYIIDCNAYRLVNGEQVGFRGLRAELRLDPCITYWVGGDTTISQQITINGDVYCAGSLKNLGTIGGDVFASGAISGSGIGGRSSSSVAESPVEWPDILTSDYYSVYYVGSDAYSADLISSYSHPGGVFKPSAGNPGGVRYCNGLTLTGGTEIEGTLIVAGDLTVKGTGNIVKAVKGFPAVVVTGDVQINNGSIEIDGLMMVGGKITALSGGSSLEVLGGLFVSDGIYEQAGDSSGSFNNATLYNGPVWRPSGGKVGGALEFDGIDDFAQTDDDASELQLLTGDYTLSVWIKPAATQNSWAGVFSKCDPTGSANHWTLQFNNGSAKSLIVYHPGESWDTGISLSELAGVWHHIAVVRNGNQMTSYLDGTLRNNGIWAVNPGFGLGHLNVGAERTSSASYLYDGLIDDLRVYNRALDPNDPNDAIPPKNGLAGLIGQWRFDESGANIEATAAPCKTAVRVWSSGAIKEQWEQVGGAFFKSIERK